MRLRLLPVLLALVALLGSWMPGPVRAAQSAPDLPAAIPSPDVVAGLIGGAAEGERFGIGDGGFSSFSAMVPSLAGYLGVDADALAATLQDAGWQGMYLQPMYWVDAADLQTRHWAANFTVSQYASPEGAAAGFTAIEDESNAPADGPVMTDIAGTTTVGEMSEITTISQAGQETMELSFVDGNMVGVVSLTDLTGAQAPTVEQVEALATELKAGIDAVAAGSSPGLTGLLLVPVSSDGLTAGAAVEFYAQVDGKPRFYASQDDQQRELFAAFFGEGSTVYRTITPLTPNGFAGDAPPQLYIDLFQFGSADAASAQIDTLLSLYTDATEAETGIQLGDRLVAVEEATSATFMIQSGQYLIRATVEHPEGMAVSAEVFGAMMQAQLDCIADGGCTAAYPVPAALLQ